jgi:hypothetical protein
LVRNLRARPKQWQTKKTFEDYNESHNIMAIRLVAVHKTTKVTPPEDKLCNG